MNQKILDQRFRKDEAQKIINDIHKKLVEKKSRFADLLLNILTVLQPVMGVV